MDLALVQVAGPRLRNADRNTGRDRGGHAAGTPALNENGPQHADAVAERAEVAGSVDPGVLEAGNLGDLQPGLTTRMWMSVSISKPSPHRMPSPSSAGDVLSRLRTGRQRRQKTL